jgi:hypothetical protein
LVAIVGTVIAAAGVAAVALFDALMPPAPDFSVNGLPTSATTLPRLSPTQCTALRQVERSGNDAEDVVFASARVRAGAWPATASSIDAALARFELALEGARRQAPEVLDARMRKVVTNVRIGRSKLADARDGAEYVTAITGELFDGASALVDAYDAVGSACGSPLAVRPIPIP